MCVRLSQQIIGTLSLVKPVQVSAISILLGRYVPVPLVAPAVAITPGPKANGQRELLLSLLLSLLALLMLPVLSL